MGKKRRLISKFKTGNPKFKSKFSTHPCVKKISDNTDNINVATENVDDGVVSVTDVEKKAKTVTKKTKTSTKSTVNRVTVAKPAFSQNKTNSTAKKTQRVRSRTKKK